jgi:hypothetical protein
MIFALTVTLPAAFALGIVTRKEVPSFQLTSSSLSVKAHKSTELWSREDLWGKKAIKTRLLMIGPTQLAVELVPIDRIVRPDVLVYWIPGVPKNQNSLPDDAFLLGSFDQSSPAPLRLPDMAAKQIGTLALYSLADQEIIATSKLLSAR